MNAWAGDPVPSPTPTHAHPQPHYHPQPHLHHQPCPPHPPQSQNEHHNAGSASWSVQAPPLPDASGDNPWGVDAHGRSFGDEEASVSGARLSSMQVTNTNEPLHPHYMPPQGFSPPSKGTLITQVPFHPSSAPSHRNQVMAYGAPVPPSSDGARTGYRPSGQHRPPAHLAAFAPRQQNGHHDTGHLPPHTVPPIDAQAPPFFPRSSHAQQPIQNGFHPAPHRQGPRPRPNKTSVENSIIPAVVRQWGNAAADAAVETSSTVAVPATPPKHAPQGGHWDDNWETPRRPQTQPETANSSPWNPDRNVAKWAERVQPTSPPVISSARATPPSFSPRPQQSDSATPASPQPSDDGPERPSSAVLVAPPTTVYISDDESVPSTKLPTPQATPHLATIGIDRVQAQVRAAMGEPVPRTPRTLVPPVLEVSVEGESGDVPYQPPIEDDVDSANSGRRRRIKEEPARPFFKAPISALYSPQWADRRLLVELPIPMKVDTVLQAFRDNFSRYGTIRYTFHFDRNGDSCEKGFVVFAEAESLQKCIADPGAEDLTIASPYTRSVDTFKVVLKHLPPEAMTKAVFIQVTGARYDDPPEVQAASFGVLPAKVTVVAVSRHHRPSGQTRTTARILEQRRTPRDLVEELHLTKKDVKIIDEVYLGRNLAEKDFIPRLCDYFGEVCWSPIPPSNKEQGWIVIMGGPNDAMRVMDELGRIPGILARYAQPGEGGYIAPSELQHDVQESPLGQLERYIGQPVQRNPYARRVPQALTGPTPPDQTYSTPIDTRVARPPLRELSGPQPVPAPLLPPIAIAPPPAPGQPELARSEHGSHHSSEGYRHLLRHTLVPTYRGRVLERVEVDGEVRFMDRAAVFVGRLSKVNENLQTLFQRFSKYGPIFAIEYNQNQKYVETTYAIARVLFHSEDAARRAIQYENGAISFGSGIKVEERRVLPADVETKEMYFDHFNCPVEPYNRGQYSPNSHLRTAPPYESTFVAPPQGATNMAGGPVQPLFAPASHVAFGYGPSPVFWQVGPVGVPMGQEEGSTLPPTPPQMGDGQLPSGAYPNGANSREMIPMIQCMGQNYYPYPVPNGVYTPDMFFNGPFAPPSALPQVLSPPRSPVEPAAQVPPEPTIITAEPEPVPSVSSTSGHGTHSPIRIKEFVMKNGNYTPVYDPDDLKRYQRERGLPEPKVYVPIIDDKAARGNPTESPETVKAGSTTSGAVGEPVYATIASPSNSDNPPELAPPSELPASETTEHYKPNHNIDARSERLAPPSHPKQRIRAMHSSRDLRKANHKLPPRPPASSHSSNQGDRDVKHERKDGLWRRTHGGPSPTLSTPTGPAAVEEAVPQTVDNGGW